MKNLFIRPMNELSKKKKKGFTLVELVIVIAIIAILAAIAIPKFGEIRENSNQKADIATAKNIATIVAQTYADDQTNVTVGTATDVTSSDKIGPKLDGSIVPKALHAGTAKAFSYTIDSTTGDIIVSYSGGTEVYPEYK